MMNEQVHLKTIEYGEKVFSCNLLQKVKRSNILDSLVVVFLMIRAKYENILILVSINDHPYSINCGYLVL